MSKNTSFLKLKNVSKFYYNKGVVASGFSKVNLEFNLGEFVVITGESGSGKSTLLNVLSGLDTYEEGELYINGEETSHYGENEFEYYRKTYIGNIFQSFNLVNSYTVYQNIELVLLLNGYKKKDIKDKINELIKQVDLYKYRKTKVSKLSGGQKQRVAIARALAKDTPIIIADEPTGNLDSRSAESVLKILSDVAKDKLVIIVTHNYEQVEKYATRKIEMYDGKIREDVTLKKTNSNEVTVHDYSDIDLKGKIGLGIRNTFNIFHKFALLFIVFLFVISAFLLSYASFKNAEYEELSLGNNNYFIDGSFARIVLNKKDLSSFTEEEINYFKNNDLVDRVYEGDYAMDTQVNVNDGNYYYWGNIKPSSSLKGLTAGRLPETENEMVIRYNYWDTPDETIIGKYLTLYNNQSEPVLERVKVVGIVSSDDYNMDSAFIFKDEFIDNISYKLRVSSVDNTYIGKNNYVYTMASNKISPGYIALYETNGACISYECKKGKTLTINVEDPYFEDSLDLKISEVYDKKNTSHIIGDQGDYFRDTVIFISEEDYDKLYNHGIKQISVYLKDEHKLDEFINELTDDNINYLTMKDANYNIQEEVLGIIRIGKMIVLIGLFVVLFFISYFVIKLIENSKKVYYATIRILGASRKVIKNLITIELLLVYHITFVLFVLYVILNKYHILNIQYIQENAIFLELKDYIIIYIVLLIMSLLISYRYSRKLFKSSAMKTYREEA